MRSHHRTIHGGSARRLIAACIGVGGVACAGVASAQPLDTAPPLPDVMLLLDTSGSMELMMDNCNPDTGLYPNGTGGGNCNGTVPKCDGSTPTSANRWGVEMQALTGSLKDKQYYCVSQPRAAGSAFASEYSLQYASGAVVAPYDLNYFLNYHRPVEKISATQVCAYGFNQNAVTGWNPDSAASHQENPSPPSPTPDFTAAQIQGYVYNVSGTIPGQQTWTPTGVPCTGGFVQNADGLINLGVNAIRFGLMTIDSDTQPNTGVANVTDNGDLTFNDVANVSSTNTATTGMWSYFNGWTSAAAPSWGVSGGGVGPPPPGASIGRPSGCVELGNTGQIWYEVGARNPAAPPWEGRMMRFPAGATTSPGTNNQQIMQAIRVMRPYGANPIAGLMDDAKYYFWQDPQGPKQSDPMSACRPQYIILLSHAAPNEDLQPYCQGGSGTYPTAGSTVGICPYDYPEYIAAGLAAGNYTRTVTNAESAAGNGPKVKTFVVGFSAASGLGDAGTGSCNDIIQGTAPNQTVNTSPGFCGVATTNGSDAGTPDNPEYAACCALARIAVNGGTGAPYFADNAADLNKAFQAILAIIGVSASTRATPVLLPQATSSNASGGASSALFLSSFTPSTIVPWSGNVQRQRTPCPVPAPPLPGPAPGSGDDFAYNLQQTQGTQRNVILVEPTALAPPASPARYPSGLNGVLRAYVNGGGSTATGIAFDNLTQYDGVEYAYSYTPAGSTTISSNLTTQITTDVAGCTYKQPGATIPFNQDVCETIAFDFAFGVQNPPTGTPPTGWDQTLSKFPSRYYDSSQPAPSSPFGGVLHSTPAIETPPSALLRDDSYQAFASRYTTGYATNAGKKEPRHTVLYVATIDGLLHAFGADYNASDDYTFDGTTHVSQGGTSGLMNEMWSFIPPAVMPNLISGLGGGEITLLDGAPVVKDTIYQRSAIGSAEDWHSTLVAGFGAAMGGYYALDVTDPDFTQRGSGNPFVPTNAAHGTTNSGTPPYMSSTGKPQGPHFLWQLTDTVLFAKIGATPAITTLSIKDPDNGDALTEVGVAILPGGAAIAPGSTTLGCDRSAKTSDASDQGLPAPNATAPYPLGEKVRQWGNSGGCASSANPASGRSLTIVRLDTGEILRTFIPMTDLPSGHALYGADNGKGKGAAGSTGSIGSAFRYPYVGRVTQADFDSPVSGTAVAFPADVGADAQKIFVGDQDGTIWRLDVSNPDTNQWFVEPFVDAYNQVMEKNFGGSKDAWANERSPIVGAPTVSVGRDGNVVLNFGTGDANAIGTSPNQNYVYSVSERRNATLARLISHVNWFEALAYQSSPPLGEMMTGPAAVFDGSFYFATYSPSTGTSACNAGSSYIWGMDFVNAANNLGKATTPPPEPPNNGGVGVMTGTNPQKVPPAQNPNAIIPGVTVSVTPTCGTTTSGIDPVTGGPILNMSGVNPPTYQITALQGTAGGTAGTAVATVSISTTVHASTVVDSWASIVE